MIEVEGDTSQPLYKFLFKYFAQEPDFGNAAVSLWLLVSGRFPLKLFTTKIVEVPTLPKPYKYHQIDIVSGPHKSNIYETGINIQY